MSEGVSSYASALLSLCLIYHQDTEIAYNSWEAETTEASCGPVLMLQRQKLQVDVCSLQILILQHVPVSVILTLLSAGDFLLLNLTLEGTLYIVLLGRKVLEENIDANLSKLVS